MTAETPGTPANVPQRAGSVPVDTVVGGVKVYRR
jgi:hypothetical protein